MAGAEQPDFQDPSDAAGTLAIEHAHATRRLDEAGLERLIRHVAATEGCTLDFLSVVLAGHTLVRDLNREHLGHDYETDVLSFALSDPETNGRRIDGEVYVDLDTAAERHEEFGTSFEQEAQRYVVHGLLHLIGYDDATDDDRAAMRRLEDQYLVL